MYGPMPFGAAKAATAASGLGKLFRLEVSQSRSGCDLETSIVPDRGSVDAMRVKPKLTIEAQRRFLVSGADVRG